MDHLAHLITALLRPCGGDKSWYHIQGKWHELSGATEETSFLWDAWLAYVHVNMIAYIFSFSIHV